MDINLYIYIDSSIGSMCFDCAVKEIIKQEGCRFDLTIEQGATGDGNDMRDIPECIICGKQFESFTL